MNTKTAKALAHRYQTTVRTVRRWAAELAPLGDDGAMKRWLDERKHVPPGFEKTRKTMAEAERYMHELETAYTKLRVMLMMPNHEFGEHRDAIDKATMSLFPGIEKMLDILRPGKADDEPTGADKRV